MILTCLYLTGCGREEVPYLDTTQTQEQTVETERTEQKETLKSDQTVQVYVCGEVAAPGVYQLKDGMRICDAVEAAGGLTKAASREYWNLAEKLSDGQMIYFPTEEEARERKASAEAAGASVQEESIQKWHWYISSITGNISLHCGILVKLPIRTKSLMWLFSAANMTDCPIDCNTI